MKRPHLFAVVGEPAAFAPLIAAAAEADLRVGWLALEDSEPPPQLEAALASGAPKAVCVTSGGWVAAKRRAGAWVLEDVLREHFLGFRAVLVHGHPDPAHLPSLEPDAEPDHFTRLLRKPPKNPRQSP